MLLLNLQLLHHVNVVVSREDSYAKQQKKEANFKLHHAVVGLEFCSLVDTMFNGCNFSNDSDCSYLFDGIPVYITALQALFAALLIMTSVPVNILLITSMIVYREMLDTSIILVISLLISNISVSLFLSGEVFLTSVARAWLFDYWGCQLIAFFILFGTSSCWILVGFLSLDRYCRVFYPFSYPRYDKKVNVILLMVSLVMCGVLLPMVHALANTVGFDITLPGCHVVSFEFTSAGATVVVSLITIVCGFFGGLLPTILYTLMYIKARRLRSAVYPELTVPDFGKLDAHKKSNSSFHILPDDGFYKWCQLSCYFKGCY